MKISESVLDGELSILTQLISESYIIKTTHRDRLHCRGRITKLGNNIYVELRSGLSPYQKKLTMMHELGHALCGHINRFDHHKLEIDSMIKTRWSKISELPITRKALLKARNIIMDVEVNEFLDLNRFLGFTGLTTKLLGFNGDLNSIEFYDFILERYKSYIELFISTDKNHDTN